MAYIELQLTTNYSFLRGASHVEELIATAQLMGYEAIAVTDRNTVAGMARASQRAEEAGLRLVPGCRLVLEDAPSLLVYPTDRAAWSNLCRLLTLGKRRAHKHGLPAGSCLLHWADVAAHARGLIAAMLGDEPDDALPGHLTRLRDTFPDRAYLAFSLRRRPGDAVRRHNLAMLAQSARVPLLATGDVLYHEPERRILQDIVTCIREHTKIDDVGFRRERFADRHLVPPKEMARLFADYPEAIANTEIIAKRCKFALKDIEYQYPDESERPNETAQDMLERLVWEEGVAFRYPNELPENVAAQLRHELTLIAEMKYAPYFLTVHSIVRFARSKGILCQGRGSAANSAVCYVLGITEIDPVLSGLLFERFVSANRNEPPDIDVDFEHEQREIVIQWVYSHYGRGHAALCATVMRFRSRGAVRDVGKVLGLSEDVTGALAAQVWGWSRDGVEREHAEALNLNLEDRRLRMTLDLARLLIGFPRQLGTHPGGFVLTRDRLDDLVPVGPAAMENRQVIEWDKDDIDHLKFMKVDVLGLGMLGCMRRAFDLMETHKNLSLTMDTIPKEDKPTFAMIQKADTLGTFQIESRAQMSMLPRLKPAKFYDLVIQVAIVRPGPIQGDMVHPYLRRREGREKPDYPTPELKRVLAKTLGVPLFQEQAMQVAIHCAGFSPSEADQLRRSMATFKVTGGVSQFREKFLKGMADNGHNATFAENTFRQIEGFGSYGFPESHAASFAIIAYASSWVKCHHPDVFCCALLNSQPMGFYAPAQVVRDAAAHGVEIRPVSINASRWDCTLEGNTGSPHAVRLGLRMAKGLGNEDGAKIVVQRADRPFATVEETWRRCGVPVAALERLAEADAFSPIGLDRRQALWAIRGLADSALPLWAAADAGALPQAEVAEPGVSLTVMSEAREVVEDYRSVSLTLRRHPVAFLRPALKARGVVPCGDLPSARDGRWGRFAGLVLVRQKPGSANGVMFITIEDETGIGNVVIWPSVFDANRPLIISARMLEVRGRIQREGLVVHIVAATVGDLSPMLASLGRGEEDFPLPHGRGDEVKRGSAPDPREGKPGIKVPTRDFR
ncbi:MULTISPECIES: error-prone DNA polymerase [unclassified Acidisoma]|jgi:error-prone DNA polymerase|uniref:error-prone DNA polymerase n=1 Tax=unclassified Acidisoma TaxID=2634065 RepID=UPI00131DA62D|nr:MULTISPECIES: error-prone DNA polymerase [unclassified Acidisoma]